MDNDEERRVSRRHAVGWMGVGVVAAAAAPTMPQQASTNGPPPSAPMIEDPRSKYPKPPFKSQTQPWPGLASKMDPKPDHGERSYRGSGG
jgi:hypothetical protein